MAAAIGLGCVGLALMLRENPAERVGLPVAVEYYAALVFFLAVSITRNGVWGEHRNRMLVPHADWLRRSIKQTSGAYGFAIVCAWLLGTIGRSMGDIVEVMPAVIFWSGLALIEFWFLAVEAEKEEQRRQRRRRPSHPRPRSSGHLTAVAHVRARYPGRCAACGSRFRAGSRIGRVPEFGWCCSHCVRQPSG